MLLAQKSYVEGALALVLYCGRLLDEQKTAPAEADRERARLLLDLLTPITKSWPAQWCLAANDLAIQVHGGYGYPATTTSSSTGATTGSTPSTRAPTASRPWTCSAARSPCATAPRWNCCWRPSAAPSPGRGRPTGWPPSWPVSSARRWTGSPW
ncbi:hypothetical protein V2I01_41385 [Micromonospora sp. BRA006-A]|nr:hypothetical protein [Micromonospora sp. BRA006-A]